MKTHQNACVMDPCARKIAPRAKPHAHAHAHAHAAQIWIAVKSFSMRVIFHAHAHAHGRAHAAHSTDEWMASLSESSEN